jgi:hypothetical protein
MIQTIPPELLEDKIRDIGVEIVTGEMESMFKKVQRVDRVSDGDYQVKTLLVDLFSGDAGISDLGRQRLRQW